MTQPLTLEERLEGLGAIIDRAIEASDARTAIDAVRTVQGLRELDGHQARASRELAATRQALDSLRADVNLVLSAAAAAAAAGYLGGPGDAGAHVDLAHALAELGA